MTTGTGIRLHVFGRFVTLIFALIVLGTCLSVAQTSTATILGTVKDASGALIPGVSITVKHTESGLTRKRRERRARRLQCTAASRGRV